MVDDREKAGPSGVADPFATASTRPAAAALALAVIAGVLGFVFPLLGFVAAAAALLLLAVLARPEP